ncbi:hypothetical protein MKK88_13250 [Methylobacterium sp. E-005]|uniref:hypothetical protein n=1 Tax=Methylobacterium sp. E-005 TaxID=2836549 RepID=UPI001FBB9F1C|nr:hypothetical protein [Methylobacterium sp. E-005]MCJ2086948.1 hypothetical protein [Methylobacterium sp. E-005]
MPADIPQLAAGAVLGFASTGIIRWWQYRRDLWTSEVERFTDLLEAATESATEYWLKSPLTSKTDQSEIEEHTFDLDMLEIKILGMQSRLDGLLACFIGQLLFQRRNSITVKLNDFSSAMTGGEFQSKNRNSDVNTARSIQAASAELLIELRLSVKSSLSPVGTIIYLLERLGFFVRSSVKGILGQ